MDSTYIVWFGTILIPKPGQDQLVSKRIESSTFVAVEDWAFDNVPEGYELQEIEKHFGTASELEQSYGPVEVNLRAA